MTKAKIAVLVSGDGTNLQALIDAERAGKIKSGEIVVDNSEVADPSTAGLEHVTFVK